MIREHTYNRRPQKKITLFQRVLAYLCLVIIAVTGIVTVAAFTSNPHRLSKKTAEPTLLPSRPAEVPQSLENLETFTLLGVLRTGTRDDPSIPVVVEPWFHYDSSDVPFYQELQQKSRKIRTVVTDYFPRYTKEELQRMGEQTVKEQLLTAINSLLVLGKIERLYFNDFAFLD